MKNILLVVILALCAPIAFAQNVPSYVPTDGLVGYWPFNGNANDISGNENNVTVNGATLTTDRNGNVNSAYSFDGVNDYIQGVSSNLPIGNSARSISAWISLPSINNDYINFISSWGYGDASQSSANKAFGFFSNLNTAIGIWQSFSASENNEQYSYNFQTNAIYHLVVTIDNNGFFKFYINSNLVYNNQIVGMATVENGGIFRFGRSTHTNTDGWAGYFFGTLDDIAIYNRALTQEEITNMYNGVEYSDTCNAVSGSLTNGLVGYWPFCGNANDDSGHGNNGTVNGATLTTDRLGNDKSAYNFDGINNYITLPSAVNQQITSSYTVSLWFNSQTNATQFDGYEIIGDRGVNSYVYRYRMVYGISQPTEYPYTSITLASCTATACEFVSTTAPVLNVWDNYVISYDGNTGIFKGYKNGILIGAQNNAPFIAGARQINIGRVVAPIYPNGFCYVNGKIDDIGIWNRALSPTEVSQLYNQNQCMTNITVTDTLVINVGQLSYTNPIFYANNITLYPNPANTQVNISFTNITDLTGGQIKIINSLGQQVATTPITLSGTNTTMPLTTWGGTGLYFVQILNAQGIVVDVKKIILQ